MKRKYIELFENFNLNESLRTAREKYFSKMSSEDFEKLVSIDPSKTYKYIEALCRFYLDGTSIGDLEKDIKSFDKLLKRNKISTRDINQLDYEEFKEEISKGETKLDKKERVKSAESEVHIIRDDEDLLIVVPNTWEASCKYGAGTKWCTTEKDNSSHFKDYRYTSDLTLYYIYDKNKDSYDDMYKIAVVVNLNGKIIEIRDAENGMIDTLDALRYLMKNFGIEESLFKPIKVENVFLKIEFDESKLTENSDGTYDYDGDLNLHSVDLESLDIFGFQLNHVTGNFNCSDNELTSLDGSPISVGGDFICHWNTIKNLEGAPETVGGSFKCSESLLESLKGAPETVGGSFFCDHNRLTSLDGSPISVGGNFICDWSTIKNLEGAPETVGGSFKCSGNRLKNLEGAPKYVGGDFFCYMNTVKFTREDVLRVSEVKGTINV